MVSSLFRRSCLLAAISVAASVAVAPAAQASAPVVGPNVQYVGGWDGSAGAGGTFTDPWGVTTAPDGDVFVADRNGARVQVFTADGAYVRSWGAPAALSGSWGTVRGIAIGPDGNVYTTASTYNPMTAASTSKVVVFTQGGTYLRSWDVTGSNVSVTGLTVGADGTVFVTDVGASPYRVVSYTSTGTQVRVYTRSSGTGRLRNPYAVSLSADGSKLYVIDNSGNDVAVFNVATGAYESVWGTAGGGAAGGLLSATGITSAPGGFQYTAEIGWQRVQLFDPSQGYVYDLAPAGSAAGQLSDPTGVAVGPDGSVYVSESAMLGGVSRVQRFADLSATLSPASTDLGTVAAGATSPVSVTLANTGRAAMPLTAIDFGGTDGNRFAVGSTTCPVGGSLAAGQSCTVQASVTQGTAGALSGTLQVHAALGLWSHTYSAAVTATATEAVVPTAGAPTPSATASTDTTSGNAAAPASAPAPAARPAPVPATTPVSSPTYSSAAYGVHLAGRGGSAVPAVKVAMSGAGNSARSVVRLTFSCPRATGGCDADGLLTLDAHALGSAARTATVKQATLARFAGVQISGGHSKLMKVRLSAAMVRRLQARHVYRVHATLTINNHLDGGPVVRTRKRILLVIPRPAAPARPAPLPARAPAFTG